MQTTFEFTVQTHFVLLLKMTCEHCTCLASCVRKYEVRTVSIIFCAQVVDAKRASYGVENATYAVVQLAQTTMRSELGKITLDKTFEERATLNLNIVESIRYAVIFGARLVKILLGLVTHDH